jgi:F-type H+-transporting ATPase subunit a
MFSVPSQARQENETPQAEEEFDASSFILEHIADSHEWHILTKKNGERLAIYLPVILYSKEKGLDIFSSRKLAHGHEYKGYKLEEEGEFKGMIVNLNEDGSAGQKQL